MLVEVEREKLAEKERKIATWIPNKQSRCGSRGRILPRQASRPMDSHRKVEGKSVVGN